MRTLSIKLPTELKKAEIYVASDWHIGDNACQMDQIKKTIDYVAQNEGAFLICNGDLINNATKTSVSDCYAEKIPPMEQLKTICDLLEPIKEKILMLTQGNHEARTYRSDGIDLTRLVARQLRIENRYCKEGGLLFLRMGLNNRGREHCYTIYATHGSGGGRKEGAKAIRLADMATIVDADIYIHSHTHLPMIMKQAFYRVSYQNSSVDKVTKLFVNTAATLDYGGYGQVFEFKPSSNHNPVLVLSGERKEFTARL